MNREERLETAFRRLCKITTLQLDAVGSLSGVKNTFKGSRLREKRIAKEVGRVKAFISMELILIDIIERNLTTKGEE